MAQLKFIDFAPPPNEPGYTNSSMHYFAALFPISLNFETAVNVVTDPLVITGRRHFAIEIIPAPAAAAATIKLQGSLSADAQNGVWQDIIVGAVSNIVGETTDLLKPYRAIRLSVAGLAGGEGVRIYITAAP